MKKCSAFIICLSLIATAYACAEDPEPTDPTCQAEPKPSEDQPTTMGEVLDIVLSETAS